MKNEKQSTKKCKTKLRERERNNLLCVGKQCIEWERELENYNKRMRIRRAKNKGKKWYRKSAIKLVSSGKIKR